MALGPFLTDIKHITFLLASVVYVFCDCPFRVSCIHVFLVCPNVYLWKSCLFFGSRWKKSQSLRCFSLIYSVFPLAKPITAPSLSSYCLTFIRERKWEQIRDGERHCMFLEEKLAVFILISLYSIIFQNAIRGANYLSSLYNGFGSDGL